MSEGHSHCLEVLRSESKLVLQHLSCWRLHSPRANWQRCDRSFPLSQTTAACVLSKWIRQFIKKKISGEKGKRSSVQNCSNCRRSYTGPQIVPRSRGSRSLSFSARSCVVPHKQHMFLLMYFLNSSCYKLWSLFKDTTESI